MTYTLLAFSLATCSLARLLFGSWLGAVAITGSLGIVVALLLL